VRRSTLPAVLLATGLLATGCAKAASGPAGTTRVSVEVTDAGCTPSPASVPAGPVTFEVTNRDASVVTEAELMRDDVIVGELENLTPGRSGTFSLNLTPGRYQVYCPNAKAERTDFTVTGPVGTTSTDPATKAALDQAVQGYQRYVVAEVDQLIPATKRFTDAVRAGDLEGAKRLYAPARAYYEEIEPVAESFGDLDPAIDVRADDVTDQSRWTGFHRIEKALWADRSLAGMAAVADRLDADIATLRSRVGTTTYQPAQLANGATELLNEVASHKITGEEDRYSHTDLSDFAANVAGAKKAFDLLVPALEKLDPQLAGTITRRFADVQDALRPYQRDGGFVDYSTVGDDQRRILTQKVDALAEPLSQVAAKVNG
jgi:iron uptake system component EfeO